MSAIFTRKDLSAEEYIFKSALIYLGMRRMKDESVQKIMQSDENK